MKKTAGFLNLFLIVMLLLTGCSADSGDEMEVYTSFLAGDRTLLDEKQTEQWWIPDFQAESMEYEYTCMDLDGDGGDELIVQMKGDPNGSHIYTIFRYTEHGETEELHDLFARVELIPEDSTQPCPYYEVDGKKVDKAAFEEQLNCLVTEQKLENGAWTKVSQEGNQDV